MYLLIGVKSHHIYASSSYKSELHRIIQEKWPSKASGVGSHLTRKPSPANTKLEKPMPETMQVVRTNWRDE